MESYGYEKIIENMNMELKFANDQIDELRRKLKNSLNKRKVLAHQLKDTHDQVEELEEQSEGILSNEFEDAILDLTKRNKTLTKKIKSLKREQEAQSVRMCEVEQKIKF